jgi:hypothetical protein
MIPRPPLGIGRPLAPVIGRTRGRHRRRGPLSLLWRKLRPDPAGPAFRTRFRPLHCHPHWTIDISLCWSLFAAPATRWPREPAAFRLVRRRGERPASSSGARSASRLRPESVPFARAGAAGLSLLPSRRSRPIVSTPIATRGGRRGTAPFPVPAPGRRAEKASPIRSGRPAARRDRIASHPFQIDHSITRQRPPPSSAVPGPSPSAAPPPARTAAFAPALPSGPAPGGPRRRTPSRRYGPEDAHVQEVRSRRLRIDRHFIGVRPPLSGEAPEPGPTQAAPPPGGRTASRPAALRPPALPPRPSSRPAEPAALPFTSPFDRLLRPTRPAPSFQRRGTAPTADSDPANVAARRRERAHAAPAAVRAFPTAASPAAITRPARRARQPFGIRLAGETRSAEPVSPRRGRPPVAGSAFVPPSAVRSAPAMRPLAGSPTAAATDPGPTAQRRRRPAAAIAFPTAAIAVARPASPVGGFGRAGRTPGSVAGHAKAIRMRGAPASPPAQRRAMVRHGSTIDAALDPRRRSWRMPAPVARKVGIATASASPGAVPTRAPGRNDIRRLPYAFQPGEAPPALALSSRPPRHAPARLPVSSASLPAPPPASGTAKRDRRPSALAVAPRSRGLAATGSVPVPPSPPERAAIQLAPRPRSAAPSIVAPSHATRRRRTIGAALRSEAPVWEAGPIVAGGRRVLRAPVAAPALPVLRVPRRHVLPSPAPAERIAAVASADRLRLVHRDRPAAEAARPGRRSTELLWAKPGTAATGTAMAAGREIPAAAAMEPAAAFHAEPLTPLPQPQPLPADMNRLVDEVLHRIGRQARSERLRRGL